MHDTYLNPMELKMEPQYSIHNSQFGLNQVSVTAQDHSPRSSPPNDYSAFDFSSHDNASMDPIYSRPYEPAYSAPVPLPPLNTAMLWPSQLTNPSGASHTQGLPILPSIAPAGDSIPAPTAGRALAPTLAPAPAPELTPAPTPTPTPAAAIAASPPKSSSTSSSTRRTLSDHDRRRMCEYHDENPTVKQTEIGAMFGVERSTVSKVLRNKEKYLIADEGRKSPVKKSKSKFPDIERTLSRWAKNRLSEGLPLDDGMIRDEARKFATTLGSSDSHSQVNDPVWLEKFKSKNQLPSAKSHDVKVEDESLGIRSKSGSQTPNGVSPSVSWGLPIVKNEFHTKTPENMFEASNTWGHSHSQSNTSLGTCFSDGNFSADFKSPTSPFFSPNSSCGPSPNVSAPKTRLPTLAPASLKRRQTVPLVGAESPTSATAQNPSSLGPSTVEPSQDAMDISSLGLDTALPQSRPNTTQPTPSTSNNSPFSMGPPSAISPSIGSNSSSVSSPLSPPSQEEARAALETLRKFIEHQPHSTMEPHDYIVLGKWMHMLKSGSSGLPGGMHSIPMLERADGTIPIGRKRSEHSLSYEHGMQR